jgi:hypothetical protein
MFLLIFPQTDSNFQAITFLVYLFLLAVLSGKWIGRVKMIVASDRIIFRGILPYQRFEVEYTKIVKAWRGDSLSSIHNFIALLRKKRNLENGIANSNVITLQITGQQDDPLEILVSSVGIAHEIASTLTQHGVVVAQNQFE